MPPSIDINSKYRLNELESYYTKLYNAINNNKFVEDIRTYLKDILKIEVTELELFKFIQNCCSIRGSRFRPLILLLNEKNIFIEQYEDSIILQYIDIFTQNKPDLNSLMMLSDDMIRKYNNIIKIN